MPESTQEKLKRVRPPRVHITYEVETEGATVIKELPFVMGVIGDFSGSHPTQPLRPLEERKFVEINRDNFDSVMKRMSPGLEMRVENTIEGNGTTIPCAARVQFAERFRAGQHHPAGRTPEEAAGDAQPLAGPDFQGRSQRGAGGHSREGAEGYQRTSQKLSSELGVKGEAGADAGPTPDTEPPADRGKQ